MVGERLKEIRIKQKKKQRELADAIGVQTSMISRYETNRDDPSDKIKVEIARFLEVSLDYLLGLINQPLPYYNQDSFFIFERSISKDDRELLIEFIEFIKYRKILRNGK